MKRIPFSLIAALLVSLAGTSPAQTFGSSDAVETAANGTINWTAGEVYAKGIGAPPAQAANAAQARAMAERAAFVVALRNLLETVKGVRVDSESVVENFMVKNDVIRTKVDGIVQGARIVKKQYLADGSVEVFVGMNMKGAFMNVIIPDTFGRSASVQAPPIPRKPSDIKPALPAKPSAPPEKRTEPVKPALPMPVPEGKTEPLKPALPAPDTKPEPTRPAPSEQKVEPPAPEPSQPSGGQETNATVNFKGGVATGLVIDGRGIGLRPALLPKIVDQQGQEVYVGQVVTRTNAVEQGVAGYAKDVNAAANNFRVTDNPAVIKALSTAGAGRTDVVIGHADAQALRQLSSKGDFLQYCRVIIVY
jgi:hypothetical protein